MAEEKAATHSTREGSHPEGATPEVTKRHPAIIPKLVESRDVNIVRQEILATYGFQVTEQFASDFIAFVDKVMKGG